MVPLYLNFGDQGYLDGVEMSRQEFYERLPKSNPLPTTASPGPEAFRAAYERVATEGATEILSIHIAIALSATVDVARSAAQEMSSVPITVFDSQQLSLGTGFIVEAAAKAARDGRSTLEIVAQMNDLISRTHVFAALDTLEYLQRSGRMNSVIAGLGGLLQLKPILKMYNGQPAADRVRTRSRAIAHVIGLLNSCAPFERVALVHTHVASRAEEVRQLVEPLLPKGEVWSVDITPVIGAHIGPGAVGFACVAKR